MGESEIKREIDSAKMKIKTILSGTASAKQIREIEEILDKIKGMLNRNTI